MWISVHTGIDGPKLRDLRKKLKCSKYEATGILIYFWFWGLENAEKDGHIICADKEDIEECLRGSGAGCELPPKLIVNSLIETGWIDETDDGLYIHDWEIWQEQWYKAKERRENDAKRKRESRRKESSQDKCDKVFEEHIETEKIKENIQKETPKEEYSTGFTAFWEVYPRKLGKAEAYKKYKTRLKDGWTEDELLEAAKNYSIQCKKLNTEQQYIKHPKTFLSDNTPFSDYISKNEKQEEMDFNPFEEFNGDIL